MLSGRTGTAPDDLCLRSVCLYAANLDALLELREVELLNLNALKLEPVASLNR